MSSFLMLKLPSSGNTEQCIGQSLLESPIHVEREVPHPHQTPLTRSRELINHNLINLIT